MVLYCALLMFFKYTEVHIEPQNNYNSNYYSRLIFIFKFFTHSLCGLLSS